MGAGSIGAGSNGAGASLIVRLLLVRTWTTPLTRGANEVPWAAPCHLLRASPRDGRSSLAHAAIVTCPEESSSMCFAHDSRPPVATIAGAAVDHRHLVLEASDGNRLAAFHALPDVPSGVGMLVLPDVRGLAPYYEELALRFAERGVDALVVDYYGRTAGSEPRGAGFDSGPHTKRCTWDGLRSDMTAGAVALRADGRVQQLFSVGFCLGGRLSFLLASLPELEMSGVIGFYGWPVGAFGSAGPAPVDRVDDMRAPVLGLFGGADQGITAADVARFEGALGAAGVEHRIVTYPDAPHSFFDRKAADFTAASDAAWSEVLAFIGLDGVPAAA
jgi:carboxymethylenebutenolidase